MAFGSRWTRDVLVAAAALALFACPPAADGARILAVQTVAGRSHWNFMSSLLGALVDAGHAVTAFSVNVDDDGGGRDNFTQVDVSRGIRKVRDVDLGRLLELYGDPIGTAVRLVATSRERCDRAYENDALRAALRAGHFDLVVTEPFFSECVSFAAGKLRVPAVYATALPTVPFAERAIAGHPVANPAYVGHVAAARGVPRTFAQRLANAAETVLCAALVQGTELWLRRTAPGEYDDHASSFAPSLTFVNGHFASDAAAPAVPNVVYVGGMHLKPVKALPQDILEFIERSPVDVICFTFGSTVRMSSVPERVRNALFAALARLPYRVLLKYEEEMADKPKNVMTKKWLPQRDILMHPKVKLFVSHGGVSGLYEAVDAGVPVLGFPLFGDQRRNVDNLANAGMAISMDLLSVTEHEFLKNVLLLLDDENEYTENAKKSSEIFKDRPMTPAQSVVFWTEYVLRHGGAPRLKSSAALHLTWYQYYLLDVVSLLLLFAFVSSLATYRIVKTVYESFSRLFKTKSD